MTCVKESQEESTDKIVLDIFLNNLGVRPDLSEIDRSHRLGPKKTDQDRNVSNRPIIIKFISYRSRQQVFKVKKKLKDSSYSIFDNLTKQKSSLMTDEEHRGLPIWTADGNILHLLKMGQYLM